MDKNLETPPGLFSLLMESLHGRQLRLYDRPEFGHPLTAFALLHQRLERAISTSLRLLTEEEEHRKLEGIENPTKGNPFFVLDSFQDVIYRAAELFDFYEKDILRYLGIHDSAEYLNEKKKYLKDVGIIKRQWSFLCNRCKHNHAFLVPVEGIYNSGDWVSGFSLYRREADKISIEKDLHPVAQVYSYNWAFRKLFACIFKIDEISAQLVNSMREDKANLPLNTFGVGLPYLNVLKSITQRPKTAMPKEYSTNLHDINFLNYEIRILDQQRPIGQGDFQLMMIIPIIGNFLKIQLPYGLGECDGSIYASQYSDYLPIGFFMRLQFTKIIVPDEKKVLP